MKNEFKKPVFIIDRKKCLANIHRMAEKARKNKIRFRPHFKTHQSSEIGQWFRRFGVSGITVSSIDMAFYFYTSGWKDIILAFPFNLREIDRILNLPDDLNLSLTVESDETVKLISKNVRRSFEIFIKIDAGHHRTGIDSENHLIIQSLIETIDRLPNLKFAGFLVHSGHTYHTNSIEEIKDISIETNAKLNRLKTALGLGDDVILSIGDTPSCSVMDDFSGIDEIRPGNFVFYDVMQAMIGSCSFNDIAVAVSCPVVARHEVRQEIIIYGGAVHLSKEYIYDESGHKIYGLPAKHTGDTWTGTLNGCFVRSLSQEHGIVRVTQEVFHKTNIGDNLLILPVHSCLTANLMNKYFLTDGTEVEKFKGI